MKNLDMSSFDHINTFTMKVSDYQEISPTLAKVIVEVTGNPRGGKDFVCDKIAAMFQHEASAVEDSFRELEVKGTKRSYIGFVRANSEIRPFDPKVGAEGMKVVASNLLMDKNDESLWEIRSGAAGAYIVRQGDEDLSSLIQLAHSYTLGATRLNQVAMASVLPREFATFINPQTEELDYGYVVAAFGDEEEDPDGDAPEAEENDEETAADDENEEGEDAEENDGGDQVSAGITVVPFHGGDTQKALKVAAHLVVSVINMDGEDTPHLGKEMASGGMDRAAMVEYYKKAYFYAPEYIQKVIKTIDDMSFA